MSKQRRPPSDPIAAAKAAVDAITGAPPAQPIPAHVTVSDGVATCAKCGATYALSKRPAHAAEDAKAFGILHRH